jgi:hypothetical protein
MALEPFETAAAEGFPTVTQISVFLVNRVGELLRLTRALDPSDTHILALSVVNAIDCAIVRMIVDNPEMAADVLRQNNFTITESEVLVVSLPPGKRALLSTWSALLACEASIADAYSLLARPDGRPALVVQADNLETAAVTLQGKHFVVLDQADLTSDL